MPSHRRHYDFGKPLDDCWELIPDPGWTCDISPGCAHFQSTIKANAEVYLRSCTIDDDAIEIGFVSGAARGGIFRFGFIAGFEFIYFHLNLTTGELTIDTQEFHKKQPRFVGRVPVDFKTLRVTREADALPGLPYTGVLTRVLLDGREVARVGQIDFLPECLFMFGLKGPGEVSLSHLTITGPPRPRPEFVHVGVWQQSTKPTTAQNVDALIEGVRQAAEAGVEILLTPETSLTGLRMGDPEANNKRITYAELARFQKAVAATKNAPYTLIGYPDSLPRHEVEGAEIDEVMVNAHRFVRPDGTLGPSMAKVHVCEEGMWHGRKYNLQRVAGVEVALGVCHDGHYQDVWSTGVMGGARLCLHPMNGGNLSGDVRKQLEYYRGLGSDLEAFWVRVNGGGGAAIVYPTANRRVKDTILATPKDMTEQNPTYPNYSPMGDLLCHARIRLWDATGCYPLRTLRAGKRAYESWKGLMPELVEV